MELKIKYKSKVNQREIVTFFCGNLFCLVIYFLYVGIFQLPL